MAVCDTPGVIGDLPIADGVPQVDVPKPELRTSSIAPVEQCAARGEALRRGERDGAARKGEE